MKNISTGILRQLRVAATLMLPAVALGLGGERALAADTAAPGPGPAAAAAAAPIDPRATEVLRRTSDYLGQAQFFSVAAEVWQDAVLPSGQRIQAERTVNLQVRRPNRMHVEVRSPHQNRGIWYDGKSLNILNRNRDLYGTANAPGTLDDAVDFATTHFGVVMPLEDLILSNPYTNAIKGVTAGTDLGTVTVLGVSCQHLAFTQANIDWQVWIEDGPMPTPKKIVITYKDEEGSPQYTALFSKWDFDTKLPDFVFSFDPPAGAQKIDIMELKPATSREK